MPTIIFIARAFFLGLKSALYSHRENKVKPLERPIWSPGQSVQKLSCSFSFVHSWTLNFKTFFKEFQKDLRKNAINCERSMLKPTAQMNIVGLMIVSVTIQLIS